MLHHRLQFMKCIIGLYILVQHAAYYPYLMGFNFMSILSVEYGRTLPKVIAYFVFYYIYQNQNPNTTMNGF